VRKVRSPSQSRVLLNVFAAPQLPRVGQVGARPLRATTPWIQVSPLQLCVLPLPALPFRARRLQLGWDGFNQDSLGMPARVRLHAADCGRVARRRQKDIRNGTDQGAGGWGVPRAQQHGLARVSEEGAARRRGSTAGENEEGMAAASRDSPVRIAANVPVLC
jgi:hypothetical protein